MKRILQLAAFLVFLWYALGWLNKSIDDIVLIIVGLMNLLFGG